MIGQLSNVLKRSLKAAFFISYVKLKALTEVC
jgi:hypothetical protein